MQFNQESEQLVKDSISIELKETANHAFLDVVITILGKTYSLDKSFTHANVSAGSKIVSDLQSAAERVKLEKDGDKIIIRTDNETSGSSLFAVDDDNHAPKVVFEHLKSLTNLRGFKII